MNGLSRRRMIAISAAAAGIALLPGCSGRRVEASTWRGQALGAEASLRIYHHDRHIAAMLVDRVVTEVQRLEGIFSLYRPDSDLVRLNRAGYLTFPPPELLTLIHRSQAFARLTGGAFDPSVQPLWRAYQQAFAAGAPPSADILRHARALVGIDRVHASTARIALPAEGAGLTFNGIAQGYITDRVVALLRAAGVTRSLVNMGEIRAIGTAADGRPWRVGLASPTDPAQVSRMLELDSAAVATSSPSGFHFDAGGRFGHIIDPHSGATSARHASVTVVAADATSADALATAFTLMDETDIHATLARLPGTTVHLLDVSGRWRMIPATAPATA